MADSCIFVKYTKGTWICVALYVDYLLIGAESIILIKVVAGQLSSRLKMKILESVRFILEIKVNYL